MKQLTKANFSETTRKGLEVSGFSNVKVLNVVNSSLGQMKVSKTGDDKTGDIRYKLTKKTEYVAGTLRQGSIQFKDKATIERCFAAMDDSIKALEAFKSIGLEITVSFTGEIKEWLDKVGHNKPTENKPTDAPQVNA